MKAIDLRKQSQGIKSKAIEKIRSYKDFTESHQKFKIGDVIEFFGGYYGNILYRTEILGFDKEGTIFLLWESYWYGIRDTEKRNIKKVS